MWQEPVVKVKELMPEELVVREVVARDVLRELVAREVVANKRVPGQVMSEKVVAGCIQQLLCTCFVTIEHKNNLVYKCDINILLLPKKQIQNIPNPK